MKEITGNLITLAKEGMFDVIAHGCNCFCLQQAGIAASMAKEFGTDKFPMEDQEYSGEFNKLGCINSETVKGLTIVNAYTQYKPGANLDYDALALCLKKINRIAKGKRVGLPQIGCGIAGGSWKVVKTMIDDILDDCDVTVVIYDNL